MRAKEPLIELPRQESAELLEIEPPLLIDDLSPEPLDEVAAAPLPTGKPDIERLELQLETAKRRAGAGERLFKSGVLAKVEVEARTLKALRVEAELENARLDRARQLAETQQARFLLKEISTAELEAVQVALSQATEAAKAANERRQRGELEIAQINVQRQKRLLSAGVGRKIDLQRAEEKLATLKQQQQIQN